jgi:RNA polymerase sigma-B factor
LSKPASLETNETLFARYGDGNSSVRSELVSRFMPLARRLAARYRNVGSCREDLEHVAYLGLIKSIDRYDQSEGRAS